MYGVYTGSGTTNDVILYNSNPKIFHATSGGEIYLADWKFSI